MLLHPADPERSRAFCGTLGLAIYREFGSGPERGTVFFLGGGFLELSGRAAAPAAPGLVWLQVRELAGVRRELGERGVRDPAGAEAGAVGAAGDVDRQLNRVRICIVEVPAGAAPPRLSGISVSSMLLPQWRVPFPGGSLRPLRPAWPLDEVEPLLLARPGRLWDQQGGEGGDLNRSHGAWR